MREYINVLIIEDDPMVSYINRKFTEKVPGFKVIKEINFQEKRRIEFDDLKNADLLLLDIYLPGEDGINLLKKIRASNINIDVIIISAAKDVSHISDALNLGVVDYLIKPFTFERFKMSLIGYKQLKRNLKKKSRFNQDEIDKLMWKKVAVDQDISSPEREKNNIRKLPKGLDYTTLNKIKKNLENKDNKLSTLEIAKNLGLSRVTVQRYLKFMVDKGIVTIEREYGKIGRPRHYYKLTE